MKRLRKPDGVRRGVRKVKCEVNNDECEGDRLFHIRLWNRPRSSRVDTYSIVCEKHCMDVEKVALAASEHVEMEWWELEDHEYETTAPA